MRRSAFYIAGIILGIVLITGHISAQDLTAEEVIDNVENAIDATSAEMQLSMDLYNASGSKRSRGLKVYIKDADGQTKSFIRFTAPADIEGTAFLSLEQDNGDEEMYLYMPVLGSVRRIAGSQKSGSFVGTDFTYNDMTILGGGNYGEDYEASIIEYTGEAYVLRLNPLKDDIDYHHTVMRVPVSTWFPSEIEFYSSEETVQKRLTNDQVEQVDGNWTARTMTMENVEKGSKTVLQLDEVQYNAEIRDRIFTTRYMERQR
ncbi:MAG: outer membrane lipoprotein-sorting protein [Candidatus Marinimicrobia bacterium]|nr:outer membrane lipoprotein-sorting protein [Candidatus Neomarinimicrobiota bacterium]MCF7830260.1 outer membrane lipoprotein-sorting protein [Candidatus Neomarinimicrobiota bacterium]MCF7882287.1 outer membrane lipoprotein-sorting protein [Candidatus Neomarinimicrobiota bacterium]